MHYYKHNIGDYRRRTGHLSLTEHGVYRQLMDEYYLNEAPIPDKTGLVYRRLQARTEEEQSAVRAVLEEFFVRGDDGCWHHKHCDEVIAHSRRNADVSRANGSKGGRKPSGNQTGSKKKPDRKLPTTHNPLPNIGGAGAPNTRGSRLDKEAKLPDDWLEFAKTERPDLDPAKTFEQFRDYWVAVPGAKGVKLDWKATWRNWVRSQQARPGIVAKQAKEVDPLQTREGIIALAREIGHEPYDETTSFPQYRASVLRAAGKMRAPTIGLEELSGMAKKRSDA